MEAPIQTPIVQSYSKPLAAVICKFLAQWKYPVCVIYGNPDTGKTDTAMKIAEIGLNEKILDHFASNVSTYGKCERITSLEDVNYWFQHENGNKLYALDEAGINDDTRNPLSQLNRKIRHNVFIARKFKGHWIFILQDIKDLDTWRDSPLTGLIILKKFVAGQFMAIIQTKWTQNQLRFWHFPRSEIAFDTLDIAPFTLDRQVTDAEVNLQGTGAQVAWLYIKSGRFSDVAKAMAKKTQTPWQNTQVKRELVKFLKQTLRAKPTGDITNDNA